MKEFGIFILVVVLSGILYWGIEPYAHHELHPQITPSEYDFAKADEILALSNIEKAKSNLEKAKKTEIQNNINSAEAEIVAAQKSLEEYKTFWAEINAINFKNGDATRGAEIFSNAGCAGCHGVESVGIPSPLDAQSASSSYGVVPPDLSTSAAIYDEKFLAAFIKNPQLAFKLTHKFNDENPFPMPGFFGAGGEDINSELADIVAYLKSVSDEYKKANNGIISDQKLFEDACQRCHSIAYDKKYTLTNKQNLKDYMGSNPPDLSMIIRAKNSDNYLSKFINDPQKALHGTSMPRVGLTKEAEEQMVTYLEKVGDSKKSERESVGIYTMIYFLILGIFATLWKRKVWKDLH